MHKFPGDLNISGSLISAKQIHLNLQNGTIGTLTEQKHETGISDARNYRIEHSKTDVGSQINTQGDLTVYSGGGVNITQGQINSGQGTVGIAGQNVRITEGRRSGSVDAAVYNKSNLGISSHSVSMHGGESYNQAQGSSITGSRVVVQAQKNLDVRGSNIVLDNQTFLGAGGAVSITAAQNTHNSHRQQRETGSGIMGTGGGILIGSQTEGELNRQSSTGHTLSTIGSTHGRVDIQGKGNVLVSGTEIIAAKGGSIIGSNVRVESVVDTLDSENKRYKESSGVFIGAQSNVTDAVAAIKNSSERGSEVSDPRLKALYAAKAAYAVKDLSSIAQTATQAGGKSGVSGKITVGVGTRRSESEDRAHIDTVRKSTLHTQADSTFTIEPHRFIEYRS
jgi:filamentous hemagglutinin